MPERTILGPDGREYEMHRTTVQLLDPSNIQIGYSVYRDGSIVRRISGEMCFYIGASPLYFTGDLLGHAAHWMICDLPSMTVIMICVDAKNSVAGATTVELRHTRRGWSFF